ncbi:MAG: hypothetical protein HON23_07060 [Rickettsiales bacterium]|jgi:hypothetical protein|nr:hypothetical protein [Rickettsiales bacterium]
MRKTTEIHPSNIADQLYLGHHDPEVTEELLQEWQFPLIKNILINQDDSKPYALRALSGGKIIAQFQSMLLEAIKPISGDDAGEILKAGNIEESLQLDLTRIIIKDANKEAAFNALAGSNIPTKIQKMLLELIENSTETLDILSKCKIPEDSQLKLIEKLSPEDSIKLFRDVVFYPKESLLSQKSKSILKQKVENRQNNKDHKKADLIYFDKQE